VDRPSRWADEEDGIWLVHEFIDVEDGFAGIELASRGFEAEEESSVNTWLIIELEALGCCLFGKDGSEGV